MVVFSKLLQAQKLLGTWLKVEAINIYIYIHTHFYVFLFWGVLGGMLLAFVGLWQL